MRTILLVVICAAGAWAQARTVALSGKPHKVKTEEATFKGKKALRVADAAAGQPGDGGDDRMLLMTGVEVMDGAIEVEVAGEPGPGASGQARGFVGIAFRVAPDVSKFECFYLRPTNGRADDQVRRNHSAQYVSSPDFPWMRLRKEFPEKYESYADLVPGEWTKVKIEFKGDKARLYVHGNEQPTLIVNDLKQGVSKGHVGLWIGPGTVAHFANLRVSR
jgi:hypothetical protein